MIVIMFTVVNDYSRGILFAFSVIRPVNMKPMITTFINMKGNQVRIWSLLIQFSM